jgi:hypothetical protein
MGKIMRFNLISLDSEAPRSQRPLGFDTSHGADESLNVVQVSSSAEKAQKERDAMKLAMSPGQGLFTTGFMLWMSGSSLQIFSIMMIGMAFVNPVKAIAGINVTFSRFQKEGKPISLTMPKLIFLGIQLLSLGLAMYKASTMGLLPLTSADWTSYIPMRRFAEHSSVPIC